MKLASINFTTKSRCRYIMVKVKLSQTRTHIRVWSVPLFAFQTTNQSNESEINVTHFQHQEIIILHISRNLVINCFKIMEY